MEESKKPWQSKTILVNFAAAAGALFYPPVAEWIAANPGILASAFAVLNILLRLVTKDRIGLTE